MSEICETMGIPVEDCLFCQGEACMLCGAGCFSDATECEHDVIDRHLTATQKGKQECQTK